MSQLRGKLPATDTEAAGAATYDGLGGLLKVPCTLKAHRCRPVPLAPELVYKFKQCLPWLMQQVPQVARCRLVSFARMITWTDTALDDFSLFA